jgi:hypothetical protein
MSDGREPSGSTHVTEPLMPARLRHLLLAAGAVALAACHRGPRPATGPEGGPAIVVFTNESLDQADVYAVGQNGSRIRIGTVLPGRTDTLRLRASDLGGSGSVTIAARLLASSRVPNTGPVTLSSGDRIAVRLTSDGRTLSVLPIP